MKKSPTFTCFRILQASVTWRVLAVWGLLFFLLLAGQSSWAHGSSHAVSSPQQQAKAVANQWSSFAPSLQEGSSRADASKKHNGTCSDCHLCCALQHCLPAMSLFERTPSAQPVYRATHYASKPLSPELPPPILVRAM